MAITSVTKDLPLASLKQDLLDGLVSEDAWTNSATCVKGNLMLLDLDGDDYKGRILQFPGTEGILTFVSGNSHFARKEVIGGDYNAAALACIAAIEGTTTIDLSEVDSGGFVESYHASGLWLASGDMYASKDVFTYNVTEGAVDVAIRLQATNSAEAIDYTLKINGALIATVSLSSAIDILIPTTLQLGGNVLDLEQVYPPITGVGSWSEVYGYISAVNVT